VTPADRVERYLDRLARAQGIDKEDIHGFDGGDAAGGITLHASDLRELVRTARLAEDRAVEERVSPLSRSCRECGYLAGSHSSACSSGAWDSQR
jgi:hypothetical protein